MLQFAPFVFGGLTGVFLVRERRARLCAERLGAATLETLLDAIDANNPETGAHVRRVADYSLLLAEAADLDIRTQHSVERVALFHDIGKIDGALTDIINEAAGLTPAERRAVMRHPLRGAEVLRPLGAFYPDLPEGVLSHHERWDGTGYPRKLKGLRIPITARVVAIADTFDAITHSRPYRSARSTQAASTAIAEGRGRQFDPDLVDLFLSPPIIESVEQAMRASNAPRRATKGRRHARARTSAPDITFRWRTTTPPPQPADR